MWKRRRHSRGASSLNFVEGAQIHHPLGWCCAFSEGSCRGQSVTPYPTQGARHLENKRQAFCYKGVTLPSAVKRTAYLGGLCVRKKAQKKCFHPSTKFAGADRHAAGKGEYIEKRHVKQPDFHRTAEQGTVCGGAVSIYQPDFHLQ
jgi:hypothetical protein